MATFRDELKSALDDGQFAMVNADKVSRALGDMSGESIIALWRDSQSVQGDHFGLITTGGFYTVQIKSMGLRYSLDKRVKYQDLRDVRVGTMMRSGIGFVELHFATSSGEVTYLVGAAHSEMEMNVAQGRAAEMVNTIVQTVNPSPVAPTQQEQATGDPGGRGSIAARLQALDQLLADGLLTQDEHTKRRSEIIAEL